ncbi:MAG TPA: hypothetical protein VIF62_36420 [Labilithrix sp.]
MNASRPIHTTEVSSIDVVFHDLSAMMARATKVTRAHARAIARWPVAVCGLLALFAASAAFTMSPVAAREPVRPVLDAARADVGSAVTFTKLTFDRVTHDIGLTR